jgi:predicted RND superfamily exporter protein
VTGEPGVAASVADASKIAGRSGSLVIMTALHYAMTPGVPTPKSMRITRAVLDRAVLVLIVWLVCVPPAVWFALTVTSDNSPDRLIVEGDEDYRQTRVFQRIFPEGQYVVVLVEAPDPYAPEALARAGEVEDALRKVPKARPLSALTIFKQTHPAFAATEADAATFKAFATGTALFRKQGLIGDGVLGIPMELQVGSRAELQSALAAVDAALAPFVERPAPLAAVRKIGGAYVDRYLSQETQRSTLLYMPLFGLFIVLLNLFLYRSFRTLLAFLATIGVTVLFTEAFAGVMGFVSTIVSSLVPLTVLITCTSTLVYLHSLFVDCPPDTDVRDHHAFTLANKFLPCTASIFAAAVGFAALGVSGIRPIREMGAWVAAGMVVTWLASFTLFPALQRLLKTPTSAQRRTAGSWWPRIVERLPRWSYRLRFLLVPGSVALMAVGLGALLGVPGFVDPMRLETDSLDYIDHALPLYQDTRKFEASMSGLTVTEAWIRVPKGGVLDPGVLRGLHHFGKLLEADKRVGSVLGPTTLLQWVRYVQGQGDALPDDPASWAKLAADFQQLALARPEFRGSIDVATLGNARVRVITRGGFDGYVGLKDFLAKTWAEAERTDPALAGSTMTVVGEGVLQAKIAHYLVPTLTESFGITAAVIFVAFLLVFRSAAARLMAMIPSVFAILVMFLVMRLTGIALNVATILIASTVLGASENDQIHFFYHFQEGRREGDTDHALRHALTVSGRAIVFATFINAGGFLALALSPLPPMRQFGIVSACAFLLSMIADFSALPASLWIVSGDKPR